MRFWPSRFSARASTPPRAGVAAGRRAASTGPPGPDGLGVGDLLNAQGAPPSAVATAFAIIKFLSAAQGGLPRQLHARDDRRRKPLHPEEYRFLWRSPNAEWRTGANVWWQQLFGHFEGWANVYLWRSEVGGRTEGLYLLHPARVLPLLEGHEKRFILDGNKERKYTPDEILHIPGLTFDGVRGIPPVEAGLAAHKMAIMQHRWESSFLRRGPSAAVVVSTSAEDYDAEAAQEFYDLWDLRHSGVDKAGGAILVAGGTDVSTLTIPPADARMLEAKQYTREEVLGFYAPGLPHHLLGWRSNTSNFGTGVEAQARHLVQFVLMNRLALVADAISLELLPPDLEMEFRTTHLLRGDRKTQAEVLGRMRDRGVLSAEEWREELGLPPREIEDDYLIPLNFTRFSATTGEPMLIEKPKLQSDPGFPVAAGQRCQNASCSSRRNGHGGRLLVQQIGEAVGACDYCGELTALTDQQVVRDATDLEGVFAEAWARAER